LLLLGGFYPLCRAWRGSRGSTLRHAVAWALLAWAAWCLTALLGNLRGLGYLSASLTACAGVAVLGARRPGAGAWHFVVAGLLLALSRPFLEGFGGLRLEGGHRVFLATALAAGLGNYLPTRQAPAVLLLGAGCMLHLGGAAEFLWAAPVALAPWAALLSARTGGPAEASDPAWRRFRDRFGFVWAQRLRDQFNRAAENAGWDVALGWTGLHPTGRGTHPADDQVRAMLQALLKRFRTGPD
jgi:hypothetical protein